jgi:hypothetical protein
MADALLEYGAAAKYYAAPFEGRHVTAVKGPARRTSRAARLAPQLAKRARRGELFEALSDMRPLENDSDSDDDDEGPGLAVLDGAYYLLEAKRELHVERLVRLTAAAVHDAAPAEMPAGHASAAAEAAVLALLATRMRRVRLANGTTAHARERWRGGGQRYDDVAVFGEAGATWCARLIAPVTFALPSGNRRELVLVRWFVDDPRYVTRTPGDAVVRAAVSTICPRLQLAPAHRLDRLQPAQVS